MVGLMTGSGAGQVQLNSGTLWANGGPLTLNFPANLLQWNGGMFGFDFPTTNAGWMTVRVSAV